MSKKRGCLWLVLLTPLVLYGLYKWNFPTYIWHEKMTLVVDTPNGEKSGHATRSVKLVNTPRILPQITGSEVSLKGEAVVLEVSEGQFLFAILDAPVGWLRSAYENRFPDRPKGNNQIGKWESSLDGLGPVRVPKKSYPLLVTFDNINDPASVREVNPNDLAATFGEGYSLKSITLEITDEPVTEGEVEKLLGWLESVGRERAGLIPFRKNDPDYQALSSTLRSISPSDFSTELYK